MAKRAIGKVLDDRSPRLSHHIAIQVEQSPDPICQARINRSRNRRQLFQELRFGVGLPGLATGAQAIGRALGPVPSEKIQVTRAGRSCGGRGVGS